MRRRQDYVSGLLFSVWTSTWRWLLPPSACVHRVVTKAISVYLLLYLGLDLALWECKQWWSYYQSRYKQMKKIDVLDVHVAVFLPLTAWDIWFCCKWLIEGEADFWNLLAGLRLSRLMSTFTLLQVFGACFCYKVRRQSRHKNHTWEAYMWIIYVKHLCEGYSMPASVVKSEDKADMWSIYVIHICEAHMWIIHVKHTWESYMWSIHENHRTSQSVFTTSALTVECQKTVRY